MKGSAQLRPEATSDVVAELRRALAERTKAQAPTSQQRAPLSTRLSVIDAALQGGLPRGKVLEIVGGAGKMAFALLALAAATQRGELCAFVDADDALDVQTARRVGVVLERLLWVRTSEAVPEPGQRSSPLRDGMKAVDLLLGAGGFGLVILYGTRFSRGSAVATTAWPRLVQRCEKAGTTLLIGTEQAVAGSFAAVTLECQAGEAVWERAPGGRMVLHGQRTTIEVTRSRLGPPGEIEELPLRR